MLRDALHRRVVHIRNFARDELMNGYKLMEDALGTYRQYKYYPQDAIFCEYGGVSMSQYCTHMSTTLQAEPFYWTDSWPAIEVSVICMLQPLELTVGAWAFASWHRCHVSVRKFRASRCIPTQHRRQQPASSAGEHLAARTPAHRRLESKCQLIAAFAASNPTGRNKLKHEKQARNVCVCVCPLAEKDTTSWRAWNHKYLRGWTIEGHTRQVYGCGWRMTVAWKRAGSWLAEDELLCVMLMCKTFGNSVK